jgi:hypothetical protein
MIWYNATLMLINNYVHIWFLFRHMPSISCKKINLRKNLLNYFSMKLTLENSSDNLYNQFFYGRAASPILSVSF